MPESPFPTPAPGFDQPLELLRACHMKMLAHAGQLTRLSTMDPADADFQSLRHRVCRYFDESAPLHHEDEERDLFPALLRKDDGLKDTICRLNRQHPELEAAWQAIRRALFEAPLPAELGTRSEAFLQALREHITLEETGILAPAERLLDAESLHRLGKAMARRRGVA